MSQNRDLLVVALDAAGKPSRVEVLSGKEAAKLFRVEHGSAGSSFPGFNVPTPLRRMRRIDGVAATELATAIEKLMELGKNKKAGIPEPAGALRTLFDLSEPQSFSHPQERQFQRSCSELPEELDRELPHDLGGLKNFGTLIKVVRSLKPSLASFAESIAALLVSPNADPEWRAVLLFQEILFGALDWKKRASEIGSDGYWREKAEREKGAKQPIYLDLALPDTNYCRVAHAKTSMLINEVLFKIKPKGNGSTTDTTFSTEDAFGEKTVLQDKFPVGPKVAELGNIKLFSVNTNEVQALQRYQLKGSQAFPVSSAHVQKMSDALLYLASEDKRGITCRAIPSALPDKRDLLIAYLEGEPEDRTALAEMFGGEAKSFSDADFEAIAHPVLEMLEGRAAVNPDLNVRLLSFCPIDKAKKQISLNRTFRVRDVIQAARGWEAGARNVPAVSVWFYAKNTKQFVLHSHTAPCPLELASVANRVWSADAKSGFSANHQRAISVSDACDVFLSDSALARQKVQFALGLLVARMRAVLIALGAAKTTRDWKLLSDTVRWQAVKAIALFGILLRGLGHHKEHFMREPITQVGRLLALADGLHQQYCKHVRKGESPSQLLGNALFSTALEQPIFALARLAERLAPYQAWARTFQSNDPDAGVGLVKYFLAEIGSCTALIRLGDLPPRMSDVDKAKLLLGYLADHPKSETSEQ